MPYVSNCSGRGRCYFSKLSTVKSLSYSRAALLLQGRIDSRLAGFDFIVEIANGFVFVVKV